MSDKIYLGTTLGIDDYYYKGIFEKSSIIPSIMTSEVYDGDPRVINVDDYYLYVGGNPIHKVFKLDKTDLSKVTESPDFGGNIQAGVIDENYMYIGLAGTYKVFKLDKTDLSKVTESPDLGGYVSKLVQDTNYIYAAIPATEKIVKLDKTDLSKVAESAAYGGYIISIAQDTDYVYVSGNTILKVFQLNKSNLSKKAETIKYDAVVSSMVIDGTHLYGGISAKIYDIHTDSMLKYREIECPSNVMDIKQDDNYLYATLSSTSYITFEILKSIFVNTAKSTFLEGNPVGIEVDNDYIYIGLQTTHLIKKLQKQVYSLSAYRRIE